MQIWLQRGEEAWQGSLVHVDHVMPLIGQTVIDLNMQLTVHRLVT